MPEQKQETSKPQQPAKPMEDDDEFEEFDVEDWKQEDEDPAKAELWEADWDDTSVSDNFSQQLRAELQKNSKK